MDTETLQSADTDVKGISHVSDVSNESTSESTISDMSSEQNIEAFGENGVNLGKNGENLSDNGVDSHNLCDKAFKDDIVPDKMFKERIPDKRVNGKPGPENMYENSSRTANYEQLVHEQHTYDKDLTTSSQTNGTRNSTRKIPKIPKSKTFDSGAISYFSKIHDNSASEQYKINSAEKKMTNSRTHVFMTSHECVVVPGCKLPRETIASRLRFEKQHLSHDKICGYDDYQTPSQRKDSLIKDLKRQVRELTICIEDKDEEIAMYKQHVSDETSKLVQGKDEEISRLREELKKLRQSYEDISSFCEETVSAASRMDQKAEDLKAAMTDRELQHQKIYLEMYRKGQESARFEREEELESLATAGGCKVTISELVKKLAWTEVELAKWQTIRRQESYQDALRPDTEAEATLRFLRDSLFHYLTDNRESDDHLRALIKIMNYSKPQIEKIKGSKIIQKIEKKRRSMSTNK